ncbi:MAG: glycoside hydrolase family 57 protein [Bacteroidales bacterium]|nr:glycoside hydrolase family 57 protein [Bacteroidales bacterium]MBN2818762.1 glycoside hydrolase family 57 protein [Bacteroidales bacterium]
MKTICLYFQVHQPMRLKRYRFFNIGNDHYYYDDYLNESIMHKVANKCYLPANKLLLQLIKEYGTNFKVTFSISGIAMDQFRLYAPEVLDSFKKLAETGCVEFLAETYSHSLVAFKNDEEFRKQVELHTDRIKEFLNVEPKVFRGTELIYSDEIGAKVFDMGFPIVVTEGAKHIMGWKSSNFLYCNAINPKQKVLLRNYELSDDLAFRFSNQSWAEYPLTAEKYVGWISEALENGETANLFLDYETFGEHQSKESGIFDFLKHFPKEVLKKTSFKFATPSEIAEKLQPVSAVSVPHPISWADEERDLTAWLGNDLQEDAFNKLYSLTERIQKCEDKKILIDWKYLQSSDHFYYMSTKVFSDGEVHSYFNPFDSPYDAYINYMNILSDFIIRLNSAVPENQKDQELATLAAIIFDKNKQIEKYEAEILKLKKGPLKTTSSKATKKTVTTKPPSKTVAKKAPAKAKTSKTVQPKTATKKKTTAKKAAATKKAKTK